MFLSLKRVIKFGWNGLCRAKGLSIQAIFIMGIAVSAITCLFFLRDVSNLLIKEVENKIDIAVYFKKDVSDNNIMELKDELVQTFGENITSIDFVSQDDAMTNFLKKHKNDKLYLEALNEVEENPFLASLSIKAQDSDAYAQIADFLSKDDFSEFVEKVSYNENKNVIARLFKAIENIKNFSVIFGIALTLIVILILFNTIKLTIFARKREIETSRLVGASNWFIRGPFLSQGIFYALFAIAFVDIIFFVSLFFLSPYLKVWLLSFNAFAYLWENFFMILLTQICFAIPLSVISALIAIRKYLKI